MIRSYISIVFFTCLSVVCLAQDIHFSQFYQSPLNMNPALTGVSRSNQRMVVNYRNQWASALGANAYNTYSASYDQKIEVGTYDYFGIGGSMWGDVAGASRFGTVSAKVSASFSYYMNGSFNSAHYLTVGTDVGMVQRRVREDDLRWPSQHDGNGGYDGDLQGESLDRNNFIYPDLSVGLMWFSILDQKNSFYAGVAAHHLNEPGISFLNQDANLYRRYTIHGGGEYGLSSKLSLLPGFVVMLQGPHTEYNLGTSVKFNLGDEREITDHFQVGIWTRLGSSVIGSSNQGGTQATSLKTDALIFSTKFESGNYGLGFSYDFTLSQFKEAGTANGAFEFSLTYLINKDDYRKYFYPKI